MMDNQTTDKPTLNFLALTTQPGTSGRRYLTVFLTTNLLPVFSSLLLFAIVAVLVTVTTMQPANALQVTGLYSYRVAVANDSDAERNRAFREALAAVIVKVTGLPRWLEDPIVARALGSAQNYVEAVSYASEMLPAPVSSITPATTPATTPAITPEPVLVPNPDADAPAATANPVLAQPAAPAMIEQRYVNVTFASTLINELLIGASVPIWDSNRPSVLVWMVLQEANGERRLLTADGDPEIVALFRRFGTERGLPVIFPVLDFEDRRSLPVESLWSLDEAAIRNASARYGADTILSGRLLFAASGELVGLWQFIFQNDVTVFDAFEADLQSYLYQPLERITAQLANYFAIVPASTNQHFVRLRVDGVNDLRAYSSLLNYVRNLGLVRSVATAALDGARLELQLGLQGDARQLQQLIALDRDLQPITSEQNPDTTVLHYRWTR